MRKLRMGMVGGGRGAFIGEVHRIASRIDGQIELVCGAFSSSPEKSRLSGQDLFLPTERCYGSYEEMILKEKELPLDERMDFVSIVTPNHMHYGPTKLALENGFHVVCDKPLCLNMEEAFELKEIVDRTGLVFALTHTYTGYPMVKQARQMVLHEELGKVRRVVVEYPQGWLSTKLEGENKQASWRTDPNRSGKAGAMGDIGTHAENLVEYVTGLEIEEICADLHTHIDGRLLDDDGSILLRFKNGGRGVLYASQISAGEENNLRIRVYGEKASIDWHQMEPNTLLVRYLDQSTKMLRTGVGSLYPEAQIHTRIPAGHPEGYLEAFANLYRNFAFAVQAQMKGEKQDEKYDFPGIEDGIKGMHFIDQVVASAKSDQKWIQY